MNKEDYEASVKARINDIPELKKIEEFIHQAMTRAGNGLITLPKISIPEVLSPVKVFELMIQSERSKIQKITEVFAEYIRKGSMPNETDLGFNQKMEAAMGDNEEVPGLADVEFDSGDNHPLAVFLLA